MPARLFIASIGNPGPLYGTLHSAGHTLLDSLAPILGAGPFTRHLSFSPGQQHALYRSPSYMNESGPKLGKAYKAWKASLPADERALARLLVLHDELESNPGQIRFRSAGSSFKGHNGLKSIDASLGGRATEAFPRIAVGIGRLDSRDSRDVANYVLRKMTSDEKRRIEARALDARDMIDTLVGNVENGTS